MALGLMLCTSITFCKDPKCTNSRAAVATNCMTKKSETPECAPCRDVKTPCPSECKSPCGTKMTSDPTRKCCSSCGCTGCCRVSEVPSDEPTDPTRKCCSSCGCTGCCRSGEVRAEEAGE